MGLTAAVKLNRSERKYIMIHSHYVFAVAVIITALVADRCIRDLAEQNRDLAEQNREDHFHVELPRLQDVAAKRILAAVFNSRPQVAGFHNLAARTLLDNVTITIVTTWGGVSDWLYPRIYRELNGPSLRGSVEPTAEWYSRVKSWHHCIDGPWGYSTGVFNKELCEFLLVTDAPATVFSDAAPDYGLHALNLTAIYVMGPPSDMFLRWLGVFLEWRVFAGDIRVLFTTHEWPELAPVWHVTFGATQCVDNSVVSCAEVRE